MRWVAGATDVCFWVVLKIMGSYRFDGLEYVCFLHKASTHPREVV